MSSLASEKNREAALPCPLQDSNRTSQPNAGCAAVTPKGLSDLAFLERFHDPKIMAHAAPIGSDEQADARNRSFRTLVQGFVLDVATALVLVLALAFTNIEWTSEYWVALGLTAAKSVLQAGVAYLMRLLVKPKE